MLLHMENFLFYGWVVFCLCFKRSSVIGQLGGFHVLALLTNAAVNIAVCRSFWINAFIYFGDILRSGIAGSYGSSSFSFMEKSPYCFALWLYQLAFAPVIDEGSLFTMFLPTFVIFVIFSDSLREMIAHCGFDLHFPDDEWCGTFSHVLVGHLYVQKRGIQKGRSQGDGREKVQDDSCAAAPKTVSKQACRGLPWWPSG